MFWKNGQEAGPCFCPCTLLKIHQRKSTTPGPWTQPCFCPCSLQVCCSLHQEQIPRHLIKSTVKTTTKSTIVLPSGIAFLSPKLGSWRGNHLLFSSKQRLVRILAAFGDLEAGENFIGCSSTRIWKQEGSLWIIFHFLSLIFVCFVKEWGAYCYSVPRAMNLDLWCFDFLIYWL